MTPERWQEVKAVLQAVLECDAGERAAFLDRACGADATLRQEVESLLAAHEGAETFLEPPAAPAGPDLTEQLQAALGTAYTLERELGGGGMSRVFVATDTTLGRRVVVKVLPPALADGVDVARFRREVRLAAQLQHPHVVPLLAASEAEGLLYYTMPYIAGESLKERIAREGGLPVPEAVRILGEVADALSYAHRHGVAHRDVKPGNVLLKDGHALVTDFGIAKALGVAADSNAAAITSKGLVIGTPAYMAPEHAAGDPAADHRVDLYSLGVLGYEVLTGESYLAASRSAVVTESVSARRADVPPELAGLIGELLEQQPHNRPQTAEEVVRRLGTLLPSGPVAPSVRIARQWVPRWVALVGIASGIAVAALGSWRMLGPSPATLDANRIVVFPLAVSGTGLPASAGEDIATLLGYAFEGVPPFRSLEAADYLDDAQRKDVRLVSSERRQAITRARRAAHYIDGSVMRQGDSSTVILRLHSVAGDSVVARSGAAGLLESAPPTQLALRAVGELLVPLIEPGRRVDLSALSDRKPAAIARFLQAEREYRAAHFPRALDGYRAAVEEDSMFALAALKGALAASWLELSGDVAQLVGFGLAHVNLLPARDTLFLRGLSYYLAGTADSAAAVFKRLVTVDGDWSEAWMALGEVYYHLQPEATDLDSLAEVAFVRARAIDPEFTPPLYHLAGLALKRGATARADSLVREYGRVEPDSSLKRVLDVALRCTRGGPAAVDWMRIAAEAPLDVVEAGVLLAGGAAHVVCARDALWAVLNTQGTSTELRWGALFALQSVLIAAGRDADIPGLFGTPVAAALEGEDLLLLDGSAGAAVQDLAAKIAGERGENYRAMSPFRLWLLGSWETHRQRGDKVRTIAGALVRKADSSRTRRDSLLARAIEARSAVLNGDTTLAIRRLQALTPSAPLDELFWDPAEGLGGERLLLAHLLLARGDYGGAIQTASQLDGSGPLVYLLYLRSSLLLRARAAEAMGDTRGAARYRERLSRLAVDTGRPPWARTLSVNHGSSR